MLLVLTCFLSPSSDPRKPEALHAQDVLVYCHQIKCLGKNRIFLSLVLGDNYSLLTYMQFLSAGLLKEQMVVPQEDSQHMVRSPLWAIMS